MNSSSSPQPHILLSVCESLYIFRSWKLWAHKRARLYRMHGKWVAKFFYWNHKFTVKSFPFNRYVQQFDELFSCLIQTQTWLTIRTHTHGNTATNYTFQCRSNHCSCLCTLPLLSALRFCVRNLFYFFGFGFFLYVLLCFINTKPFDSRAVQELYYIAEFMKAQYCNSDTNVSFLRCSFIRMIFDN